MNKFFVSVFVAVFAAHGVNAAKAGNFEVTTTRNWDGGWTSTYRDLDRDPYGSPVSIIKNFKALPTNCDNAGVGGFEVVNVKPGERRCVGAR